MPALSLPPCPLDAEKAAEAENSHDWRDRRAWAVEGATAQSTAVAPTKAMMCQIRVLVMFAWFYLPDRRRSPDSPGNETSAVRMIRTPKRIEGASSKMTVRKARCNSRWYAGLMVMFIFGIVILTPRISRAAADIPGFKSAEEMIPMRDGVKLHTLIFSPEGLQGKLPILFLRTPYGVDGRASSLRSIFQRTGRRRLYLCLPGHPREVQVGGGVRDDPSPARPRRSQGDRRGNRRLMTRSTG